MVEKIKMMKKSTLVIFTILVIFLLSICFVSKNAKSVECVADNENHYNMQFENLNAMYTHDFVMEQGEKIQVHIEMETGDIKVKIQRKEDVPIYEGNGDVADDFIVNILEDGVYTVSITGRYAKGSVSFFKILQ